METRLPAGSTSGHPYSVLCGSLSMFRLVVNSGVYVPAVLVCPGRIMWEGGEGRYGPPTEGDRLSTQRDEGGCSVSAAICSLGTDP